MEEDIIMYDGAATAANGHDYRTTNIRPQLRGNPRERVQPAGLFKRRNEGRESGTFMTEFESDNSESHDTDFAILGQHSAARMRPLQGTKAERSESGSKKRGPL
jgi:hypothetical protein